jgi:AcrR family transcriptional regulator
MSRKTTRKTYHHGDARNALLAAGLELIATVGAAELSLRGVAERAGLSRQAPYNHFADKEALLAELARIGFERLESRIRAIKGYPKGTSLDHAANAYIEFAQSAPALFRLMFSRELVDLSRCPAAMAAAHSAFGSLAAIVGKLATPQRAEELSLAAWCLVHGYATLSIEMGLESQQNDFERARLFARVIRNDAVAGAKR